MKIIFIIAICLLMIITIIIIWGVLTYWKFICNKWDNYEKLIPKALKLLQKGVQDSSEYSSLGNKLGAYFLYKKNIQDAMQAWCKFFCRDSKHFSDTEIKVYIKDINNILPLIKKELAKIKSDKSVKNDAVIHIRCSDVPFIRHFSYHLQPKAYYKWVVDKFKRENIKTIHFLLCTNHNKKNKKRIYKCNKIAQTIRTLMKEFLPNVEMKPIICPNILKSYQMFLGCKILAQGGAGPSSFSFFPGLTKGKNFLTPKFISENSKHKSKILDKWIDKFPWSMWSGNPIWHSSVQEYYSKPNIHGISVLSTASLLHDATISGKSPRIIWFIWPGYDPMPEYLKMCIETAYHYNDKDFDIRVVHPHHYQTLFGKLDPAFEYLRYAHRANHLRMLYLERYGGFYFDTDTICLQNLSPLVDEFNRSPYASSGYEGKNWDEIIGASALGPFRANSPLAKHIVTRQREIMKRRRKAIMQHPSGTNPRTDALSWGEMYALRRDALHFGSTRPEKNAPHMLKNMANTISPMMKAVVFHEADLFNKQGELPLHDTYGNARDKAHIMIFQNSKTRPFVKGKTRKQLRDMAPTSPLIRTLHENTNHTHDMVAYYINVKAHTDRRDHMFSLCRRLGLEDRYFEAVPMDDPEVIQVRNERKDKNSSLGYGGMASLNVGHKRLLKRIRDDKALDDDEWVIIFEDDTLENGYIDINIIKKELADLRGKIKVEFAFLGACAPSCSRNTDGISLCAATCTHAYAVTRRGAQKVLELIPKWDDAVDQLYKKYLRVPVLGLGRKCPLDSSHKGYMCQARNKFHSRINDK